MLFTILVVEYEARRVWRQPTHVMLHIFGVREGVVSQIRSLLGFLYSPNADYGHHGHFTVDILWFHVVDRKWELPPRRNQIGRS